MLINLKKKKKKNHALMFESTNRFILNTLGLIFDFNPFVSDALFLYSVQTSENRKGFWCFQGVEKEGTLETNGLNKYNIVCITSYFV